MQDDRDGLPFEGDGLGEKIASLFCIKRNRTSSKFLRLPSRGALGNGLRVVVGAVLSTRGTLAVCTRGQRFQLDPRDDGTTAVLSDEPWDGEGTRVEVRFGKGIEPDPDVFAWAQGAKELAGKGDDYHGKSSPHWYDSDSFWELLQCAGDRTVREFVSQLDGCGSGKAGQVAADYRNRAASSLSREEAEDLLKQARDVSSEVNPKRLGYVGELPGYFGPAKKVGSFSCAPGVGGLGATIPFLVEAWAVPAQKASITVCVNRTPVTCPVHVQRNAEDKRYYELWGCNLYCDVAVKCKRDFRLLVNVLCPGLSLMSDGKGPDLDPIHSQLILAIESAIRKAKKAVPAQSAYKDATRKKIVFDAIPRCAREAGGGKSRYSQRQLWYEIRPDLIEAFGEEPNWKTFCQIVTEYERLHGPIPGMYRDVRGVLYHPHLRVEIPLGTLAVEKYEGPEWTFNKILYCEKEGFFPILRDAQWPERHDCALLTAKGFATRAARDILDLMAETGEPVQVFCIHDADGPGTLIYEKLLKATAARAGRKVHVHNLGLDPWEAVKMRPRLTIEQVKRKKKGAVAVAAYVLEEGGEKWREWLQTNRSELNAMNTPRFLRWLDEKIAPFEVDGAKLIPPPEVVEDRLKEEVMNRVKKEVTERILAEADAEGQIEEAYDSLLPAIEAEADELNETLPSELEESPADLWSAPVCRAADELLSPLSSSETGAPAVLEQDNG